MLKADARKKALISRKTKDSLQASKIVVDKIISSGILKNYSNIGIYYPIGTEINIMDIMKYYPDKSFYLPITKDEIAFIKYEASDLLTNGPFKTMEPIGKIVSKEQIDCYIIPCVAISKDSKRLGYGKGYYDRYLENYQGYKIGICYKDFNNIDFEADSFDVKLDLVITD